MQRKPFEFLHPALLDSRKERDQTLQFKTPAKHHIMSSHEEKSKISSPHKAAKDLGFNGFPAFLSSHGLHIWDPSHVEEGKEILRSMGYNVL